MSSVKLYRVGSSYNVQEFPYRRPTCSSSQLACFPTPAYVLPSFEDGFLQTEQPRSKGVAIMSRSAGGLIIDGLLKF